LEEGIIGDLVLPSYAVLDPKARKLFSEERKIPLFKKKTVLYVQLRPATAGDTKPFDAHLLRPYPKGARFYVELHQEPPLVVNPSLQDFTNTPPAALSPLNPTNFECLK
jgi:hypothetical protein